MCISNNQNPQQPQAQNMFFAMISRMRYINRWGLMRNTQSENLYEHSFEVAIIAHAIALIGNKRYGRSYPAERLAILALYHDASEIITGDLPTPVKYHSPEIRAAYGNVEQLAVARLISLLPEELQPEYASLLYGADDGDKPLLPLLKAADKISAIIKCIEEAKSGNQEFKHAEQTLREAVRQMHLLEADDFISECLPAFSLTLDELR